MSLIAENSMQIDVNNSGINNAVAVQGDHIGRKIKITLLSQGEVVDLTNCTATVKCSANGKTIAVNTCDISDNVVTVELTKTMLAFAGKIKMQVSVTDSGGAVISTPIIYLIVSESISTTPVEETPDFSILADLTGRIMAVLNDPAVGDTEVKDARGGYTVLGDRLKAVDNATAEIINTLGKHTHTKNIYTAANWSLYNGITMTPHSDGGYVSFNGTANTSSQTFLLSLDKSIKLDANKATFVLAKIRLRAVGADVTVSFRDDAFFNSTNVIATNAQTITGTWITDKLTDGEWRTIWVVTGGDKTITKLGVQPLPTTSDYELQVSSIDCYYSADGAEVADVIARLAVAEGNISSLQNSVKANADNITSLQTTTSENTANISDLQSTVNGSASTSGTVRNQIAAAKSEIVEESINPLAERVTATESDISTLSNAGEAVRGQINELKGDLVNLDSHLSETFDDIENATMDYIYSANVHDLSSDEDGVLSTDGKSIIQSQTVKTTAFIPVKENDIVYLTAQNSSGNFLNIRTVMFRWISFYSDEKLNSCIGIYAYQNGYAVPEGARYMRCSYVVGTSSLFEITFNWYPTRVEQQSEYIPTYARLKKRIDMNVVDCWGDSRTDMSEGTSFTDYLNTLLGDKFSVNNYGISSQSSGAVAMRLGALDVYVSLSGNKIPKSGEVLLNGLKVGSDYPVSLFSFSNTAYSNMILNGINGRFVRASTENYNDCKFERFCDGVEQSVRPKTKLLPFEYGSENHICVFWFGKNDFAKHTGTPVPQIIDNYKKCVEKIGHDKFVILGETCSIQDTYKIGGTNRAYLDELNAQLKTIFPHNFIDINAYLSSTTALVDVGLSATTQDREYISNGFPAYQLMRISGEAPTDEVHLSTKGREAIAHRIYDFFVSKGWVTNYINEI